MVGIISGNQLGLQQSSLFVLGGQGMLGQAKMGRAGENVYVNAMTGNLVVNRTDEMLFGVGPEAGIGSTYNSLGAGDYDNADNWQLSTTKRLTNIPASPYTSGSITRTDWDGSVRSYSWDAGYSAYVNRDGNGAYDTLAYDGTAWIWTDGDSQATETYEVDGSVWRLAQSKDADGNIMSFSYTGSLVTRVTTATSTHTEYTDLIYSGSNLTSVETHYWDAATSTTKTLTRVRYGYDGSNRLTSTTVDLSPEDNAVSDGKVYTTTYTYDGSSTRVASITQTDGSSISITYDGSNRVASYTEAVASGDTRTTSFSYDSSTQTTITDPLGQATVIVYNVKGWIGSITPPAPTTGGTAQSSLFYYNNNGDITTIIYGTNNRFDYYYDSHGNRIAERDSAGNTLVRTFSAKNELLAETRYTVADPDSATATNYVDQVYGWGATTASTDPLTSRFAYDSEGHLRFAVSAEGRVTEYQYNTAGQQTSAITYAGHTYDLTGIAFDASISESTLSTWVGGLTDKSTALRADTTYDFRGAINLVTSYGKTTTAGAGDTSATIEITKTYYVYDQAGQLLEKRNDASTYPQTFVYDGLGRLVATTDKIETAAGGYLTATTTIDFQDSLNKTLVTLADGVTRLSTYDKVGELVSVLETGAGSSPPTATTTYEYDALGRLRVVTDPSGVKTYAVYDDINRKVADIAQDGTITEYRYHAINNQLAVTIRYKTQLTSTQLAQLTVSGKPANIELSALSLVTDSADRWEWRVYDRANRLIEAIDAAGYANVFTYDAAGRLTKTTSYATAISSTTVAGWKTGTAPTTLQTPSTDATNDRVTRNFYDKTGRVVGTLDAEGYLTQIAYDGAGQTLETVRYATKTSSTYWASGTFAQLLTSAGTNASDIHNYFVYDRRGLLRAQIDGEGDLVRYHYTALGHLDQEIVGQRLTSTQLSALLTTPPTLATLPAAGGSEVLETRDFTRNLYGDVLTEKRWVRNAAGAALVAETDTYTYDNMRRLKSVITSSGLDATGAQEAARTQNYRYDARGRLSGKLGGEGSVALAALGGSPTSTQIDTVYKTWGETYTYDDADRLIAMTRSNGTNGNGNRTLYYYNTDGQLVYQIAAIGSVTSPQGSVVEYKYNAFGERTDTVIHATMISSGTLATLTGGLVNGTVTAAISNNALDGITTAAYNNTGTVASVTDARGSVSTYTYNSFREQLTSTTTLNGTDSRVISQVFDRRGLVTSQTVDTTRTTAFAYDAFGRATQVTDPEGVARLTGYDRAGRTVSSTDGVGNVTTFAYDGRSRVVTKTDPLSNTTTYAYDESGRKVTVTTPEGVITVTQANAYGQTVKITDGAGRTTSYSYDKDGNLKTVKDALNNTVTNNYDEAGRLEQTVDPRGYITSYTYDAANLVLTRKVDDGGLNLLTTYTYDGKGQQVSVTDPSGTLTTIAYSKAGDRTSVVVDAGSGGLALRTDYTYDVGGRTLTTVEAYGTGVARTTQYTYDKVDQLTKVQVNPSGLNLTTQYAYDKNGNVVAKTDAAGKITRYFYDGENRQTYAIDAVGAVTKTTYTANGLVASTRTYAATVASGTLAGWPLEVTAESTITGAVSTSSNDEVANYVYDKDNRLKYLLDATLRPTEFIYDGAGNVIRSISYAGSIASGTYTTTYVAAQITSLGLAALAGTRTTRAVFDAANRQAYAVDAEGTVTAYTYDAAGNAVKQVRFADAYTTAGDQTQSTMNTWATTSPRSTNTNNRTSRSLFDGAGRAVYAVDAESYVTQYKYDPDGQVTDQIRYAATYTVTDSTTVASLATLIGGTVPSTAAVTKYAYDGAGRLVDTYDPLNVRTHLVLDALGQATDITRAYGHATDASTTHRIYDAAGRVTSEAKAYGTSAVTTTAWTYDGVGRVLTETRASGVSGEAATTTFTYDAVGQVLTETVQLTSSVNAVTTKQYDAFGNVVKVTDANSGVGFFYYDALNRLVLQVDPLKFATKTEYSIGNDVSKVTRYVTAIAGTPVVGTQPTITTNAADAVTTIDRDRLDRVTKITDAEGYYEQYTLNAFGDRVSVRNKLGGVTTNLFDKRGLLTQETLPVKSTNSAGTVTSTFVVNKYSYDARGNQTQSIEAFGFTEQRTTNYVYDLADRLTSKSGDAVTITNQTTLATTTNQTPTESIAYDARGNVIQTTKADGSKTFFYYDALDRKTAEINALGGYTVWSYDHRNNSTTTKVYGDAVSLPSTPGGTPPSPVNGSNYRLTTTTYDLNNRLLTTSIAGLRTGSYSGSTYTTSANQTVTTTNQYDAVGNLIKQTDANGNDSFFYYDKLGRKTAQVDQEKFLTTYAYDGEGNVTQETRWATAATGTITTSAPPTVSSNAADRITNFTYDKNGRRLTEQRMGLTYTTVGSTGALTTTTGGSATITYTYNGLGGVTRKTEGNGDYVDYTFDLVGRQLTATTSAFTDYTSTSVQRLSETFYDGVGEVTREVVRKSGDATQANWRVTKYDYVKGRLDTMTDAENFVHTYGYDIAGRVVKDGYSRQKSTTGTYTEAVNYRYDALGRLTLQANASYVSSWAFGDTTQTQYNVYGEVTAKGKNGMWQETFEYDSGGRVWRSNQGDGVSRIFLYDGAGNVTMTIASSGTGDLSTFATLEGANSTAAMYSLTTGGALGSVDISGYVMTINTYDKRNLSTATREPFRQLTYDIVYTTYTTGTIVKSRTFNAFGEVKSETDARGNTTDFAYNTMGRLTKKDSPYVNVTDETGTTTSARPVEEYYYDAAGRLVAVKDANLHTNARALLAGSGMGGEEAIELAQFHADGQVSRTDVDVFGDVRELTNELGRVETRDYDKMGRLLTLTRPTRTSPTPDTTLVEYFTYDGLGQRLKHWNSQLGSGVVEKTEYDREGRVISFTDFGGYATTYAYAWDATIATTGLATFGGWTKTTVNTANLTSTDKLDYFGRTVNRVDFGANTFGSGFDKAAHKLSDGGKSFAYFNTGMMKSSSDSWSGSGIVDYEKFATATYGYDLDGNRISERYDVQSFHWVEGHYDAEHMWEEGYWQENDYVYQNSTATYDALNRLTAFTDAATNPDTSITNLYDAVGNVRRTSATYSRADTGASSSQDYWYKYDSMNRFTTTKGQLVSGAIVRGTTGTDLQYDAAGQRVVAISTDYQSSNHREEYTYGEDGYLETVKMGNGAGSPTMVLRSTSVRDAMGRLTSYVEYWDGTSVSYSRTATYNNKSELQTDIVFTDEAAFGGSTKSQTTTYYYNAETSAGSWTYSGAYMGGVVTGSYTDTTVGGANDTRSKTTYAWYGDARQLTITKDNNANSSTNTDWVSTMSYAGDGRLVSAWIEDGDPRRVNYTTDALGQVLSRVEGATATQGAIKNYYFYLDGIQLGATSNKGTGDTDYAKTINNRWSPNNPTGNYADFDQSYTSMSPGTGQAMASSYTVRDGDTLQSIASQTWGDSSLWYLIADANGLDGTETLVNGRNLTIPANIRNIHNTSVTFKPYDPNIALGNNAPSRKKPPKAPSLLGTVLMVVIAVVVSFLTYGALTGAYGGALGTFLGSVGTSLTATFGAVGGTLAAGAIAGAAGSIASQGVGVAANIIDKFDWKQVGISAIAAAVTAGLSKFGPLKIVAGASRSTAALTAVGRGAVGSVITQGVSVATGLQDKFSWTSVAVQAVSAGVGSVVSSNLPAMASWANSAISGIAGGIAGAGAQSLIDGTSFGDNLRSALPSIIGNTIGNMLIDGIRAEAWNRYVRHGVTAVATDPRFETFSDDQRRAYVEVSGKVDGLRGRPLGSFLATASDAEFQATSGFVTIGSDPYQDLGARVDAQANFLKEVGGVSDEGISRFREAVSRNEGWFKKPDAPHGVVRYDGVDAQYQVDQDDYDRARDEFAARAHSGETTWVSGVTVHASYIDPVLPERWMDQTLIGVGHVAFDLGNLMQDHREIEYGLLALSALTAPVTTAVTIALFYGTPLGKIAGEKAAQLAGAVSDRYERQGYSPETAKFAGIGAITVGALALGVGGAKILTAFLTRYAPALATIDSAAVRYAGRALSGRRVSGKGAPVAPQSPERPLGLGDMTEQRSPELNLRLAAQPAKLKSETWGSYLARLKGPAPAGMYDPHAHHIVYQVGNGPAQKALVAEGQEILRSVGIDPINGPENLVWAPMRVAGQHGPDALESVVSELRQAQELGLGRDEMAAILSRHGEQAAQRHP